MKMSREKFRSLQKYWYDILRVSGFKDVERLVDGEPVLYHFEAHEFSSRREIDKFDFEMDQEYYRALLHVSNDETTKYKNDVDKIIMRMHAEGAKIRDIIHSLLTYGETRNRASIRYIIRRYEMAWNIRKYTAKQLNKKVR